MVANALYDHQTDPRETINLVERPENAAQVAELKTLLASNWKSHSLPKTPAEAE
jgi:hypothetical protein